MPKSILITGGAGYIGSHVLCSLAASDENLITLDNLSTGFRQSVVYGSLIEGDLGNQTLLEAIFSQNDIEAVIHMAGSTVVPESIEQPLTYYDNNVLKTHHLVQHCLRYHVPYFIYSSSAAVYGQPKTPLVSESTPCVPINPYGRSKLMAEWIIEDACRASSMKYVNLRYFNVAGADPQGRVGQSTAQATHLIKVAVQQALNLRSHIQVYGTDYPTQDGTGVRDYIHVSDLADAHRAALDYLRQQGESVTLNCGYGHGFSVRQVLDAVARIANKSLNIVETGRRAGDPAALIADPSELNHRLDWTPKFDDLEPLITSAYHWEQKLGKIT